MCEARAAGHHLPQTLTARRLSGRRRSLLAELSKMPGARFSPPDKLPPAVPQPLPPADPPARAAEPALTLPADSQERLMSLAVLHRSLEVKREV